MDEADRILNLDFEKEASEYFTYMCHSYKKTIPSFSSRLFFLKFRFATGVVSPARCIFAGLRRYYSKTMPPPPQKKNNPINACIPSLVSRLSLFSKVCY